MKMPAGKYWLCDPCYTQMGDDHDFWCDEYLENGFYICDGGVFEVKGHKCAAFSTAYGDGTYPDNFGNHYDVDAGMIGLTPVALHPEDAPAPHSSVLIDFKEDFQVSESNGTLVFGHYVIETAYDADFEEF